MKPFDIFSWQPPGWPARHPAVIVSNADRAANKPEVEVLMCSSKRAGRAALPGEILLDEADGLDWPTICKCDLIHAVKKSDLTGRRGEVAQARRAQMVRLIIAAHAWGEILAE
jgi:mRNA-degrading endonuclease toxin of MazEF toxin-antitoxin module